MSYQYFNRSALRGLGIGATESRNPLPPGQYTIEVDGVDNRAKMAGWLSTNAANVIVLASSAEETGDDDTSNDTYTWVTKTPITWDASMGYPTIMTEDPAFLTSATPVTSPVVSTPAAAPASSSSSSASSATTAPDPTMTSSYVLPSPSSASYNAAATTAAATSNGTKIFIALAIAGGAYYYAKKKGML